MPTTETPTWWADVQQDREDLDPTGRRSADDWLGEDIDFVPRRRVTRSTTDHPLHGVFVAAPAAATTATDTLETGAPSLSPADDPYASPPPAPGERRTVQIKGRPEAISLPSNARRHRPRTAADVVGHRPDRIVMWAVALGVILILLAAMTSSSQAAEITQHAAAVAAAR